MTPLRSLACAALLVPARALVCRLTAAAERGRLMWYSSSAAVLGEQQRRRSGRRTSNNLGVGYCGSEEQQQESQTGHQQLPQQQEQDLLARRSGQQQRPVLSCQDKAPLSLFCWASHQTLSHSHAPPADFPSTNLEANHSWQRQACVTKPSVEAACKPTEFAPALLAAAAPAL